MSLSKKIINNDNPDDYINEYLDLTRCSSPFCSCGKCITIRRNVNNQINYSYNKNIESSYKNEFNWKKPEKTENYKNTKNSGLESCFRENLKNSLVSVMKNDYTTKYKKINDTFLGKNKTDETQQNLKSPFLGRSNYNIMYPDWQSSKQKKEIVKLDQEKIKYVPFNGKSSYSENYYRPEERYYIDRVLPILKKDNLEISGKLISETTTKETYKLIDYQRHSDLNSNNVKFGRRPSSIVSAPYCKDSFLSSYERAFMYNNLNTKAKILNNSVLL